MTLNVSISLEQTWTSSAHGMEAVLIHLFGYSLFSFRKSTFDELKVFVKECQFPMLLVLTHIQSKTNGDETSYTVDGTCSKGIIIPFTSHDIVEMTVNFHEVFSAYA